MLLDMFCLLIIYFSTQLLTAYHIKYKFLTHVKKIVLEVSRVQVLIHFMTLLSNRKALIMSIEILDPIKNEWKSTFFIYEKKHFFSEIYCEKNDIQYNIFLLIKCSHL
jgi:hypothetical protein